MRPLTFRELPDRALAYLTAHMSAFGEEHRLDWLTYSPLQMLAYHRLALRDADAVAASLREAFPDCVLVADIGCGSGAFAAAVRRRGCSVLSCERALGGRLATRLQGVAVSVLDLDQDPPAGLPQGVQLAYCFEVAEHCTPAQGDQLVRFLAASAPIVVFTAAHPGQGGLGHVNEQEQRYWISRFEALHSSYSPAYTDALRSRFAANGVGAPWFHDNVMVFCGPAA